MKLGSVPIRFAAGLAVLIALAVVSSDVFALDLRAAAKIFSCQEPNQLIGKAILREEGSDEGIKEVHVLISTEENSVLAVGKHGVHIHETGKCNPCGAAGGHFDPGPFGASNPDANHPFHMGDLVNIEILDKGIGRLDVLTTRITLSDGPLSVFDKDGSAIIIHDFEDTFCPEGEAAGCAGGSRAACGVIELVD